MTCAAMDAVGFGELARTIANTARAVGLEAPVFRSPPRDPGVVRAIRRRNAHGHVVVSVAYRGRRWEDVAGDLVAGVLVANGLTRGERPDARAAMLAAAARLEPHVAAS